MIKVRVVSSKQVTITCVIATYFNYTLKLDPELFQFNLFIFYFLFTFYEGSHVHSHQLNQL